jgi:cytochrome P450
MDQSPGGSFDTCCWNLNNQGKFHSYTIARMNTQPVSVSQLLVWRRAIQGLFNQHPFNLLSDLGKRTEPILVFRVAGEKIYFFNEPDLVKEVLVTCHAKLRKGRGLDRVKQTLGNGLLTSEGDLHRQQRRIIQPVFNHRNLQAYADPMIARASRVSASWKDSQPVNMTGAMMALTLSIVCQTLFGTDVESETHRVGESARFRGVWKLRADAGGDGKAAWFVIYTPHTGVAYERRPPGISCSLKVGATQGKPR